MGNLGYAKSFRDLMVYQRARRLSQEVFQMTRSFPRDETYSLTDPIRRSVRSIGANVAEAWAKRRYERHFVSKLTDADGEQQETQHWIETALDCGYLAKQPAEQLTGTCEEIGRMLGSMIAKSDLFCGDSTRRLHESAAVYFVTPTDSRSSTTEH